jgi:hypothetical protein
MNMEAASCSKILVSLSTLKMKAIYSSEMLEPFYQTTRHHTPEHKKSQAHCLKSSPPVSVLHANVSNPF